MSNKIREREIQIKKLQQNLSPIRKIAGWTAEVLGDKIGVTKQTISNLENKKTPMNLHNISQFAQSLIMRLQTTRKTKCFRRLWLFC